jgi:hypothetical protein
MTICLSVLLRYLWVAPATMVGLALATVACALGATVRSRQGVLEVAGGRLAGMASLMPRSLRFLAITFGHVVIGVSHSVLAEERAHEHTHVRQYERWGLLFFPLYLASSAAQFLRGRHPYWHNRFECQAFQAVSPLLTTRCNGPGKPRR